MELSAIMQLIISGLTLLGVAFAVYSYFRNPDVNADKEITRIKDGCVMKHSNLDRVIGEIKSDIREINSELKADIQIIKENHLSHIEKDIAIIMEKISNILKIVEK